MVLFYLDMDVGFCLTLALTLFVLLILLEDLSFVHFLPACCKFAFSSSTKHIMIKYAISIHRNTLSFAHLRSLSHFVMLKAIFFPVEQSVSIYLLSKYTYMKFPGGIVLASSFVVYVYMFQQMIIVKILKV